MKSYVISLTSATDRRKHIEQEFGKYSIEFEFFDAIEPDSVSDLAMRFSINIDETYLTKGEIACLFSHVCLWQKILDSTEDVIAIFEDDIVLSQNISSFNKQVTKLINEKTTQFDLIKLETFQLPVKLGKSIEVGESILLKKLYSCHYGAAGYVISRHGASQLITHIGESSQNILLPVDHILFETFLEIGQVYQVSPAICIQEQLINETAKLPSSLEENRKVRFQIKKEQNKRRLITKIIAEVINPFKKLYKKIFYEIITFHSD